MEFKHGLFSGDSHAQLDRDAFTSRTERTAFFANVDLIVNVLTLVLQIFATGQVLRRFGVAITLTALPLISLLGFGLLALWPTLDRKSTRLNSSHT